MLLDKNRHFGGATQSLSGIVTRRYIRMRFSSARLPFLLPLVLSIALSHLFPHPAHQSRGETVGVYHRRLAAVSVTPPRRYGIFTDASAKKAAVVRCAFVISSWLKLVLCGLPHADCKFGRPTWASLSGVLVSHNQRERGGSDSWRSHGVKDAANAGETPWLVAARPFPSSPFNGADGFETSCQR
ncbi:hypothetical protein VTI74DRAFT_1394 [Chaetomium olivicolor]